MDFVLGHRGLLSWDCFLFQYFSTNIFHLTTDLCTGRIFKPNKQIKPTASSFPIISDLRWHKLGLAQVTLYMAAHNAVAFPKNPIWLHAIQAHTSTLRAARPGGQQQRYLCSALSTASPSEAGSRMGRALVTLCFVHPAYSFTAILP